MMNTNSPSKDRKNVQYQSPGKLLITNQAAGYIPETTMAFDSKINCILRTNDLFVVDRIHQSLKTYHWTLLPRPLGATGPSIILCVKKWSRPAPQPRGSSHSPEGKNGRVHLIKTEGRGYKKNSVSGFSRDI